MEAINIIRSLKDMKYVYVSPDHEKIISNGPPFWNDINQKLPSMSIIKQQGSCCTGLINIVRRINKLSIPTKETTGGTDAWFNYLQSSGKLHCIQNEKSYPIGTMLIQDYNEIDQGHTAIICKESFSLLECNIIHNIGSRNPDYNKVIMEKLKDYDNYDRFTHVCYPQDWVTKD